MDISLNNASTVTFKSKSGSTDLLFGNPKELELLINKENHIKSPGEFEYSGFSFVCNELSDKNYTGNINGISITDEETISVLNAFDEEMQITTEKTDKIPNINLLLTSIKRKDLFKDLLKVFQPDKVIFVGSKNDLDASYTSDFNLIESDSNKLKFSISDFSEIDDKKIDLYILN